MIKRENPSNNPSVLKWCLFLSLLVLLAGCAGGSGRKLNTAATDPARIESNTPAAQETIQAAESPEKKEIEADDSEEEDDLFFGEEEGDEEEDDLFFDEEEDDFFDEEEMEAEAPQAVVSDPFHYFNKAMFHFNDKMYFWVLKPVATGYRAVTPTVVRKGVSNFFHNLTTPIRFVSSALQGKVKGAGSELGRFVVNSTVGVLGFGDPAKRYLGLNPSDEDLGQTLGRYGIGNGPYVVWPVFGPSTLRDTVGLAGDHFLNPVTYVEPNLLSTGIKAADKVNAASFRIGDYEAFKKAYLDPYERMKEFYIEHRKSKVAE